MNSKARTITIIGMLSAIAGVLMLMEFPVAIFPKFLEIDFSDLPALIAAFMINPLGGVIVVFMKNVINIILTGTETAYIGEAANFIIGTAFVLPAGLIYHKNKSKKGAQAGMLVGILSMAVIGALANYYILIPFYAKFMFPMEAIISASKAVFPFIDSLEKIIVFSIIPFNLLKGTMASVIALLIYKRLSHLFKR